MESDFKVKIITFLYKLSYLYTLYLIVSVGLRVNSFIIKNKIFSVESAVFGDFTNRLIQEWMPLRNFGFIIVSALLLVTLFLFLSVERPSGYYILGYSIRGTVSSIMLLMLSFAIGSTAGSLMGLAQNKTFYENIPFSIVFGIFLWIALLIFGPLFVYLLFRTVKETKKQAKKNYEKLLVITGIICVTIIAAIILLSFIG